MDKNSVIGLVLIGLLVIGYSVYMQPSEQEIAEMKRQRDSVEAVGNAAIDSVKKVETQLQEQQPAIVFQADTDSVREEKMRQQLDVFAPAGEGKEEFLYVENELLKVGFSTRGGKVHSVELKKYKDHYKKPVVLFGNDSSVFELKLSVNNRIISTNNLYFTPLVSSVKTSSITAAPTSSYSTKMGSYISLNCSFRSLLSCITTVSINRSPV